MNNFCPLVDDSNSPCQLCKKKAEKLCGKCKQVKYCSRECQLADFKTHKAYCKELVGIRDIRKGRNIEIDEQLKSAMSLLGKSNVTPLRHMLDNNPELVHLSGTGGVTLLTQALTRRNVKAVQLLLQYGANVNPPNPVHQRPLLWAAISQNSAILNMILDAGADVAFRDYRGGSVVISLASEGILSSLKVIVEKGGCIHTPDNSGTTPLMIASQNEHEQVVRYLLEKGADPNVQADIDGRSAIYCTESVAVTKLLLEHGANPDVVNFVGNTALTMHCAKGCLDGAKMLLSHGADPRVDPACLYSACQSGHLDIALLLIKYGAFNMKMGSNSAIEMFGVGAQPPMSQEERARGFRLLTEAYHPLAGETQTFTPMKSMDAYSSVSIMSKERFYNLSTKKLKKLMNDSGIPENNTLLEKRDIQEYIMNSNKVELTEDDTMEMEYPDPDDIRMKDHTVLRIKRASFNALGVGEMKEIFTKLGISFDSKTMLEKQDMRDALIRSKQVVVMDPGDW